MWGFNLFGCPIRISSASEPRVEYVSHAISKHIETPCHECQTWSWPQCQPRSKEHICAPALTEHASPDVPPKKESNSNVSLEGQKGRINGQKELHSGVDH